MDMTEQFLLSLQTCLSEADKIWMLIQINPDMMGKSGMQIEAKSEDCHIYVLHLCSLKHFWIGKAPLVLIFERHE
jgi:hypothetical protein